MAELLGLIASIISIIEGAAETKKFMQRNFHSASSFRAELIPLLGKLIALSGILRGLKLECELDEPELGRTQVLEYVREPLLACKKAATIIAARLEYIHCKEELGRKFHFGKILDKETLAALKILDHAKPVLELALEADQRTLLKSVETYVRNLGEDVRDLRLQNELHYSNVRETLDKIVANDESDEKAQLRSKVLSWVSQLNYSSVFASALNQAQLDDTSGQWLFKHPVFQAWAGTGPLVNGLPTVVLVLRGISGAGKTVLSTKVLTRFGGSIPIELQRPILAYHFFDFNDPAKQDVKECVRSLVFQLAARRPDLPDEIQALHRKYRGDSSIALDPLLHEWTSVLSSLLNKAASTFIIIDGLDECADSQQRQLINTLVLLTRESGPAVRWFLTCRQMEPFSNLSGLLPHTIYLDMRRDMVGEDIKHYVATRLQNDPNLSSFNQDTRELITMTMSRRSGGMFRWAQCQLDLLAQMADRRPKKVVEALSQLPQTLNDTYRRIRTSLTLCSETQIVHRVLALACFSARPVTVAEAAEFVVIDDDTSDIQDEDRFEDFSRILALLGSFIDVRGGMLSLSHKSVQDFLLAEHQSGVLQWVDSNYDLFDAHYGAQAYIAYRCLQYLLIRQVPVKESSIDPSAKNANSTHLALLRTKYPLLEYAATEWPFHANTPEIQDRLVDLMEGVLSLASEPNLWKAWLMLQPADIWERRLALVQVLCKASLSSTMVPNWSQDFWKTRQGYRIRTDMRDSLSNGSASSDRIEELIRTAGLPGTAVELFRGCDDKEPRYMAKALYTFTGSHDSDLSFQRASTMVVRRRTDGDWWNGVQMRENRRHFGIIPSNYVQINQYPLPSPAIRGLGAFNLAILLLEVGLQKPLFETLRKLLDDILFEPELKTLLGLMNGLCQQACVEMGWNYAGVLSSCLEEVSFLEQTIVSESTLGQGQLRDKILPALALVMRSGFSASRQLIPSSRLNFANRDRSPYPPQAKWQTSSMRTTSLPSDQTDSALPSASDPVVGQSELVHSSQYSVANIFNAGRPNSNPGEGVDRVARATYNTTTISTAMRPNSNPGEGVDRVARATYNTTTISTAMRPNSNPGEGVDRVARATYNTTTISTAMRPNSNPGEGVDRVARATYNTTTISTAMRPNSNPRHFRLGGYTQAVTNMQRPASGDPGARKFIGYDEYRIESGPVIDGAGTAPVSVAVISSGVSKLQVETIEEEKEKEAEAEDTDVPALP